MENYKDESWKKYMNRFSKSQIIDRLYNLNVVLDEHRDLLLETTKNLGHPSYGISSSVTLAIDKMRENNFDYLGIDAEEDEYKKS
jgi:hypothetical protein